jgi:citronellol/citronellal dehydrogenase
MSLAGRTLFITGGSRGIGLAIALRAARDGANVVIGAKTTEPHAKLDGTIYTAETAIQQAGGRALALPLDVRDAAAVQNAVDEAADYFGGIDICVNNASAIALAKTEELPIKRFDLLQQVNTRGTFLVSRACLPHLRRSPNPHILALSPPLNLQPAWFGAHLPYTLSKFGMSMVILGLAEELRDAGVACNALWPRTTIATAAVEHALGGEAMMRRSRTPEIMAEAAYAIFDRPAAAYTGNFVLDEDVLREDGLTDFDRFAYAPGERLMLDLFVEGEPA